MLTTPDLRKERLQQIKELYPDLFTDEGKLNPSELKSITESENISETEKFEFRWFGKAQAKRIAFTPSKAALVFDEQRTVNPNFSDGNLIIEGESLEVVKLLLSAYRGQIKCIYIDPPYNTGKDLIYLDNYTDTRNAYWEQTGTTENGVRVDTNTEADGRFHSNWLNMMYSRLLVSKDLLTSDSGVLFVSIDDNEVHRLRLMMDGVFGEKNHVATFVWNTEGHTDNQYQVKINHEYILCYTNSKDVELGYQIDPNTRKLSNLWKGYAENSITKNGPGNPPSKVTLPKGFPCEIESVSFKASEINPVFYQDIDQQGYITRKMTEKYSIQYPIRLDEMLIADYKLENECIVYSGWANVNILKQFIENDCNPIIEQDGSAISFYLSLNGVIYYKRLRSKARNIVSVLRNMGTTELMRVEIEKMGIIFKYPKPKQLMSYLVGIGLIENEGYILDFFAGSGTTAQAVMDLNREDGGNRKYILVQLPELTDEKSEAYKAGFKKISDITIERVKSVIEKYEKEDEGKLDIPTTKTKHGFKVYKLTKSFFPRNEFEPDPEKTDEENTEIFEKYISDKEDALTFQYNENEIIDEVLLKNGFMLDYERQLVEEFTENKIWYIKDSYKSAYLCLDYTITLGTIEKLKSQTDQVFICLERALDSTQKWNLKQYLGDKAVVF